MAIERIIFGAGCFWGVEATFRKINGVHIVTCGYAGGHTNEPTYNDVCTGTTGHVEVVQMEYESNQITFEQLLDVFWHCHDPTTLNRQGADIGTQYRSAIFCYSPEQEAIAKHLKETLQKQVALKDLTIVTEITLVSTFHPAEEYHQRYFEKNSHH